MTALDAVGVLDDITEAALKVPGVDDAVAVVRKGVRAAVPQRAAKPAPREPDLRDGTPAALDGGPLNIPEGAPATLQEALRAAAELAPDKGTIFITKGHEDVLQTYPALLAEAERVLAGLRFAGLRPGDAALFQFDDNKAYLSAFWACVLGGFVPTPVGVATTYRVPNETNRKLHNAWNLLGQPVLLTDDVTAGPLAGVRELWGEPEVRILTVGELAAFPPDTEWFEATHESPVLNLLTSGSTGVPKCVHHTNASVVARSLAVAEHCGLTGDDISLIWMPFDHVTVAMYNVRDVFLRCMHINAKIEHSLGDPLLWLDWVDRYRATNTWAPNFAFAMANEHAEEIRTRRSWDLSCLREITNAGEPVVASTSHRFLELLAPHGLPADAMRPVWGMSETCSGVTYARQRLDDKAAGTVAVDPSSLSGNIRHVDPRDKDAVVLSSVGRPLPGVQIRVVDDTGKVVPEGRLGELRIRGLTMMHGYFANDDANRESYDEDGWFRTGDLAFVHNGEVVIAGRKKDQIIVRGINYMAHEIESVVEQVDGVRVTFAAAAGVREPGAGTDQLVVFFVPLQWDSDVLAETTERVRATLVREAGIAPDLLVPVTEREFPKTGSGKIQRGALVDGLRAGTFDGRAVGTRPEQEQTDTWLFRRQWAEVTPAAEAMDDSGVLVVFAEDDDLRHLDIDGPFVTVRRGESFAEEAPDRYRVRTDDRAELRRLLVAVASAHGPVSTVVHALPLTPGGDPLSRLTAATAELTSLVGALADAESGRPLLLVVTAGSVHVHDGDSVDLGTCALPALVRTAVGESTSTVIRQLDLPADTGAWAQAVRTELADRHHTGIIAARQGRRWQPRLSPVEVDGGPDSAAPPVIAGGTYLVTGGLGGIAQDIASYLVAAYGARLLLVGRSPADGARPACRTGRARRCRLPAARCRRCGSPGSGGRRGRGPLGAAARRCPAPGGRRPDSTVGRPRTAHGRRRVGADLRRAVPRQGRRHTGRGRCPRLTPGRIAGAFRFRQRRIRRAFVRRVFCGQRFPHRIRRPLAPRTPPRSTLSVLEHVGRHRNEPNAVGRPGPQSWIPVHRAGRWIAAVSRRDRFAPSRPDHRPRPGESVNHRRIGSGAVAGQRDSRRLHRRRCRTGGPACGRRTDHTRQPGAGTSGRSAAHPEGHERCCRHRPATARRRLRQGRAPVHGTRDRPGAPDRVPLGGLPQPPRNRQRGFLLRPRRQFDPSNASARSDR